MLYIQIIYRSYIKEIHLQQVPQPINTRKRSPEGSPEGYHRARLACLACCRVVGVIPEAAQRAPGAGGYPQTLTGRGAPLTKFFAKSDCARMCSLCLYSRVFLSYSLLYIFYIDLYARYKTMAVWGC